MPFEITNPHFLPGNISGSGLQHTDAGRAVDTRYAIRLDGSELCLIEHPHPGALAVACTMSGIVEGGSDRVRTVLLTSLDGAVHLANQLITALGRVNPEATNELIGRMSRLYPPPAPASVVDVMPQAGRPAADQQAADAA